MQYFSTWPDYSCVMRDAQGKKIIAYGKNEPSRRQLNERNLTTPSFPFSLLHPLNPPTAIGKHEPPSPHPEHHGHISALSISNPYRSLGLAHKLNAFLEQRSGPDGQDTWFLDLFVRCCNTRAIAMYEKMGYSVFRRVVG